MKLLVIGRTGQLGSVLISDAITAGHDVVAPAKQELDILDESSFLATVKKFRSDIVINTAVYHNVPLCEDEPIKAFQLNCVAVKKMAEISNEFNSWFISFTTDYVLMVKKESHMLNRIFLIRYRCTGYPNWRVNLQLFPVPQPGR